MGIGMVYGNSEFVKMPQVCWAALSPGLRKATSFY